MFVCFLRFYLFIFRERERREKGSKRNIDWWPLACSQTGTQPATQACALMGNRWRCFGLQAGIQSPEPTFEGRGDVWQAGGGRAAFSVQFERVIFPLDCVAS